MSYDLAVFDPGIAISSRIEFLHWYEQQTEWAESHGYNDPQIPSSPLQEWFRHIIVTFPPMNGPLRSKNLGDPRVTDYSLGAHLIFGAFSSSQAELAYSLAFDLAGKCRVGFYDASGDPGDIWLPGEYNQLIRLSV
jgi:hypothetical protein